MDEHGCEENAEEEIRFPSNVLERRRDEVGEREIKSPIGRGCKGNGLATDSERVQFGRIDPGNRSPGRGVGGDKEVGTCDKGLRGWSAD